MQKQGGELRALRQVTLEMQNEPAPDLDWDRIERSLIEQAAQGGPQPVRSSFWWRGGVIAVAAAAALILGFGVLHYVQSHRTAAQVARLSHVYGPAISGSLDGSRLAVGDRVVAGTHAVRVQHAGRATWTLAPHSAATLAVRGRYLTIHLDSGSLSAEVVPSKRLENFAVEVGQTRIAVHGTRFVVQKVGDRARVVLTRGVVAVGSAKARGHTQGWLMTAPATGTFSLDGARTGQVDQGTKAETRSAPTALPHPAPSVLETQAGRRTAAPKTARNAPAGALPEAPPSADLDRGATQVVDVVRSCFAQKTESSAGLRTTAHPTLSIQVAPDGRITTLRFSPPLAPPVQRCSATAMSSVHFQPSRRGATVTRTLTLEH